MEGGTQAHIAEGVVTSNKGRYCLENRIACVLLYVILFILCKENVFYDIMVHAKLELNSF